MVDNVRIALQYRYDAFGNEKDPKDTDPNPFRYCGEYFDLETEEYYLRARSYDPTNGRFLTENTHWNSDNRVYGDEPQPANQQPTQYNYEFSPTSDNNIDISNFMLPDTSAIRESSNLFAYCMNDPVNLSDGSGEKSLPNWAKIAIGVVAIGIGVIATVATGGAAAPVLLASIKMALSSAAIGAVTGAVTGALTHRKETGSWEGAGKAAFKGAVDGAADGFMWGGIAAGATFTTVAAKGAKIRILAK